MKKEKVETGFITRIKHDYEYRTFFFSTFSFFATVAFMFYNLFLAITLGSGWNIGICVYYAVIVLLKACVGCCEIAYQKAKLSETQKEAKRKNLFFVQSLLLLLVDFALIAPISLMVLQQRAIDYSQISAIAIAAYTVYKIAASTTNFIKTRQSHNLGIKIFKTINFVDALASVLTLQYTLIMTFDKGLNNQMFLLCAISSFVVWVSLLTLSAGSLIQAIKLKKSP